MGDKIKFVASLSGGKDSLAMLLRLMDEHLPVTHVVFYDTGMEYNAIYRIIDKIEPMIVKYGAILKVIRPKSDFLMDMLIKPINKGKPNEHYGMDWCGGVCRWRTHDKVSQINSYLDSLGECVQYIGIAADEVRRLREEKGKIYPLAEWGMTEADCLEYCRQKGWNWKEGEYDLYDLLDRVSCWCCSNKNLKELRNMYHFLPEYWGLLKGMQSRIDRPFRRDTSIFDLESRFKAEDAQMSLDMADFFPKKAEKGRIC